MLTNNEAIRATADLITHSDNDEDLGRLIWETHLTDPDTQARDLTMITVVAVSFARKAFDYVGLGTTELMEQLTTLTHFEDITARFHDDGKRPSDG